MRSVNNGMPHRVVSFSPLEEAKQEEEGISETLQVDSGSERRTPWVVAGKVPSSSVTLRFCDSKT